MLIFSKRNMQKLKKNACQPMEKKSFLPNRTLPAVYCYRLQLWCWSTVYIRFYIESASREEKWDFMSVYFTRTLSYFKNFLKQMKFCFFHLDFTSLCVYVCLHWQNWRWLLSSFFVLLLLIRKKANYLEINKRKKVLEKQNIIKEIYAHLIASFFSI